MKTKVIGCKKRKEISLFLTFYLWCLCIKRTKERSLHENPIFIFEFVENAKCKFTGRALNKYLKFNLIINFILKI